MKLDETNTNAIIQVANKLGVPASTVTKIMETYYSSLREGIESIAENDLHKTIKMDFFGKLVFSQTKKDRPLIARQIIQERNEANGISR